MRYGKKGAKEFFHCRFEYTFSYFMLSQKIRNLMLSSKVTLQPDWAIHELNKYFNNKIAKRAEKRISREEIELIVLDVMQKLIAVPKALYIDKWDEAMKIAEQFDVKDTPFIALALKLNIPIWAEDEKMIEFGLKTGKLRLQIPKLQKS